MREQWPITARTNGHPPTDSLRWRPLAPRDALF